MLPITIEQRYHFEWATWGWYTVCGPDDDARLFAIARWSPLPCQLVYVNARPPWARCELELLHAMVPA